VYGLYLTYRNPAEAYFVTPARIWELSIGGIIVFLPDAGHRNLRLLLPWLGLTLIAYPFIKWGGSDFPGWHALVPTIGTALIIWAGTSQNDKPLNSAFSVANLSRFRPAQFLGDISYSLYLWHWPLIILVPLFTETDLNHGGRRLKIAIFIISVALAWISYRFVESPAKRLSPKKAGTPKIWAVGIVCLTIVIAPAHLVEVRATDFTDNIVKKAFERATDPSDIGFGARAVLHRDRFPNPYGSVDREWAQFGSTYAHGIMDDPKAHFGYHIFADTQDPFDSFGEFGDLESDKIILVLGDSHVQHWFPAIDIAARNLGYKVIAAPTVLGAGGIYELTSDFGDTWISESSELSVERNNERFDWVRTNLWPRADIVLVGVANSLFTGYDTTPVNTSDAPKMIAKTFREIAETTGNKPILIQDNPQIEGNILWIDKIDKATPGIKGQTNSLYDKLADIDALDSFDYLKTEPLFFDDDGIAHSQIGGVPVYADGSHINTLYSASSGEFFTEKLKEIIGG
jgi:hypothetical protein